MHIETEPLRASARRLSVVLMVVEGLLILTGFSLAVGYAARSGMVGHLFADALGFGSPDMAAWQGGVLTALAFSQLLVWGIVVSRARGVFDALEFGQAARAAEAAGILARWLWVLLVWGMLAHALASVVATWHFALGSRSLALSLGSGQLATAFAALLAAFTARALALGALLWDDHREVI